MTYSENIKKLRKACNFDLLDAKQIIDNLYALQSYFFEVEKEDLCYVPMEPNFQIPNVFLKTALNTACKKFITENTELNDYTDQISLIIEELDSFSFLDEKNEQKEIVSCDQNILDELILKRYKL